MKILVCFKYVKEESEITVHADRTLNLEAAQWTVSQYDLNAIEAAMLLGKTIDGTEVDMLTVSGDVLTNSKMRKAALSRGPVKLYGVQTADCGDALTTAKFIAQAVERVGDVDLVIFGEGSSDMYSQILGNMVGSLLSVPTINGADKISFEDGAWVIERNNGSHTEIIKISGKAVVSVTSDICKPRIPSMKDILAAGKKAVEVWDASEFEYKKSACETVSVLAPKRTDRKQVVFKASDEDGIDAFVRAVKKYV